MREFEFIPEQRKVGAGVELFPHNQIVDAGFFELKENDQELGRIAFNFDRKESDMQFADADALALYLEELEVPQLQLLQSGTRPFVQTLTDLSQGKQLWRWFVLAALLFFLIESLLLRFVNK